MWARRLLVAITIVTLLVVAGAFAMFELGGSFLLRNATPQGHFELAKAGIGPDYTKLDSWLCRPGNSDDPCLWQPSGEAPARSSEGAAVFYVHPTTYLQRDRWNAPIDPGGDAEYRTRLFAQSQASAFFASGQIWAPRYRQASYGAFLLKSDDAQKALDLAYSDVSAAFDEFLRANPAGPIILAGHSQGALLLERLLREKVAGKAVAKRVVAAFVVGWPISITADLPQLGLPACTATDQAGCILSWMTFGDPPNPDLILGNWEKTRGFNGGDRRRKDILCVNPVTGTKNGADTHGAAGSLVPAADFRSATISSDELATRCSDGLLVVDGSLPNLGPFVLPGNNYHVYDYALFWGAIRADAGRRLAAWAR